MASSFVAAALMYPFDLIRALSMANAGSSLTTIELLRNFKNIHGYLLILFTHFLLLTYLLTYLGYKGFFTQGLVPEVVKATWARFIKFSLYPVCHKLITNGLLENQGTAATKVTHLLTYCHTSSLTYLLFRHLLVFLQVFLKF